jgi:DNA repair protein RAD50
MLVVTRSLSLTAKKNTVVQKTLDCQLLMEHHGERTSMSKKLGEMGKIVPLQMGVSTAVLESVIFCHQDESLWPMSEPKKLKEKFDELFEAQKYTKAVEAIVKVEKDHKIKLGQHQLNEKHYKENKDRAERVEKQSIALQNEIEILREKHFKIKADLEALEVEKTEKHRLAIRALGIVDGLKTKRERANYLEGTLSDLRINFEERHESDAWLQSTLEQFEVTMAKYSEQDEEYQAQYKELQDSIADSRRQMSMKQAEKGQLQAEKDSYERQLESRVQLVKEAARLHSLRGFEGDLDEGQILDFVGRVQKKSREKDQELDRIRKDSNDELEQTQAALSNLGNLRATRTQEKTTAQQTIKSNDKKLNLKSKEMGSIGMNEGIVADLTTSLNDIQDRLRRASSLHETAGWKEMMEAEGNRLLELESESNRLRDELFKSNQLATDRAALIHQKAEAKKKQNSLNTMLSTYTDQLTAVVGSEWRPDTLEQEFQTVLDQRSRTLADAKKQQDGAIQELREQEYKLQTARSNLTQKKGEMQKSQTVVLKSIITSDGNPLNSVDDYLRELESIEKERDEARQELDGITYVSEYYRKGLNAITQHNCCRLCERTFADKKEQSSAKDKIEKALAKYVKNDLEVDLQALETDLKSANAARSQYDMYKKLHDVEIPALEKDVERMENKKKSLVFRLEQCDNAVNEEEAAKSDVEALSATVNSISKYCTEILNHDADITRLSSQQKLSGSTLSADEIQEQTAACDERIRAIRAKIDRIKTDKDRATAEINHLESESANISNRLNTAKFELKNKQRLQEEIDELRENNNLQRDAIKAADEALESLGPEFAKAKAQHEDTQRREHAKAKDVQAEKYKLSETVNRFKLIDDTINSYINNGGPGKLAACERAIKALEEDQKQIQAEMNQLTTIFNDLKKEIDDSKRTKTIIVENIRYRKTLRDLEVVKNDIAELEARNVTDDWEKLNREAKAADNRFLILQAEHGPLLGAMRTKDELLQQLGEEYESQYKDAAEKYKEMHITVETTKAAIDDMKKYSSALGDAIMKYHNLKMQEINAIAGELWRSTYQGTDVDTIMIRSEVDSSTSKKSHNYRVVMVKQDAEMDMRGRCSAGQKVLASIIIRLALAECFGSNCGVSPSILLWELVLTNFRLLLSTNQPQTLIKTTLELSPSR